LGRPGEVEVLHLAKVDDSKATAKTLRQVMGELPDNRFTIVGPFLALLLELYDPSSDLPVCSRHERIDAPHGCRPGSAKQFDDLSPNIGISLWRSLRLVC
jgi:hypothetical protein